MRIERLLFRVRHLERQHGELSHSVVKVHSWAEQQLRAVRGELTVARGNDAAAHVLEPRAQTRAALAAPELAAPELAAPELEEEPELEQEPKLEQEPEDKRDTIATPTTAMPAPKPSDEDSEATTVLDLPLYALRSALIRPPAPLAHPDLMGGEDIADETAHPYLGPDETTPPRRGRAAMRVAAYPVSEEGGAQ